MMETRAKVNDVIKHGQGIPANVRSVRDKVKDLWERERGGWILAEYDGSPTSKRERAESEPASELHLLMFWAPLTVVEVDPEPQLAVCPSHGTHPHEGKTCLDCPVCRPPAEPQPAERLTLPEVPEGAVALIGGKTGHRYTPGSGFSWESESMWFGDFGQLLIAEDGEVTVEFAPPREPRTWPQIVPVPDDISEAITVEGITGIWYRVVDAVGGVLLYRWERIGQTCTVLQLRELGDVTEVLDERG